MTDLRSDFEPGSTRWAVRRAQWTAMGITDAHSRGVPKIAVVNTSSALSVCFAHLDDLADTVAEAIRAAGGLPFEIRTTAPSDFVTSAGKKARYLMPTRDLIVNDIEAAVEGAQLDGMVCLSSCDKTTPAHLMAAGRLDLPSIIVVGGYQVGRRIGGCGVDIDSVYESVGAVRAGSMTVQELGEMADNAIQGPGVCAGLGTANTMHILAEALGMTMPGSAPVRANSASMVARAVEAGHRIVAMVRDGISARQILTEDAVRNAVEVALAVGGSVNCVRHLSAIANESELGIDVVSMFEKQGADASLLTRVRPNGPHEVADLDRVGGARAVMRVLAPRLATDALTVSGSTVAEVLAAGLEADGDVLHGLKDPAAREPGLLIMRGTLAPDGAIVKSAGLGSAPRQFTGTAIVFRDEDDAIEAIAEGRIRAGDVVVLRGMGPRGGPGTVFVASFVAALVGAGLGGAVAVVTDGELSGLNHGMVVGQVMPEAADGGPLAGVRDGDTIVIDIATRTVDAVPLRSGEPVHSRGEVREHGWLAQYGAMVGPVQEGAVLRRP